MEGDQEKLKKTVGEGKLTMENDESNKMEGVTRKLDRFEDDFSATSSIFKLFTLNFR